MTRLETLKGQFKKAVMRLEEILKLPKNDVIRDSAVKRFEFSFDLGWKLMRVYLREEKGIDCSSPKDGIRAAYRHGFIDYDQEWLEMTDWRNEIVHAYGEEYADRLYENLPKIHALFQKLSTAVDIR